MPWRLHPALSLLETGWSRPRRRQASWATVFVACLRPYSSDAWQRDRTHASPDRAHRAGREATRLEVGRLPARGRRELLPDRDEQAPAATDAGRPRRPTRCAESIGRTHARTRVWSDALAIV